MLANEDALRQWRDATDPLRQEAVDAAVGAYFDALGKSECPGSADIQAAAHAAETSLAKRATTPEWIAAITRASPQDPDEKAALELAFNGLRPPLRLPPPVMREELSPFRIGLAAVIGAIGGMFVLTPLTRLLLGMRDVGLFVGPPVGAFLLVVAVWYSARSKWLRRFLIMAFGVATIGEVWGILTGGGILRLIWFKLGRRGSALKRIFLYVGVIFVVAIAKPRARYDRQEHERLIRSAIDQWLDAAVPTLGLLMNAASGNRAIRETDLWDVAQRILELPHVAPDNLPAAIEELIQSLKNSGFEVEERKTFCWRTEHKERYKVFGHVEPGDRVVVESRPVVVHGEVRRKGLVRKVRKGT